ncbi:spr1629 family repressor/antitoxin [Staphylococcus americanisciuri]|uniref:XRE family transcriptional regulator n=1 Tax=Staphylococcus americanisciuri TaxID=2973940 RepID=A0ABT2F1V7_9STAP|nr:XRE family transcriptional regulator [Staphylococcus americanisciuri]MCS4486251.1 XRE family transcriptional regulator [Staphylococcus americanisciuri]
MKLIFYGEKLSNIRKLNGLSRKELAEQLDITEQAIWQYENDSMLPRIDVLNKLGQLFNVDTKYFFTQEYLIHKVSEEKIAYRAEDRESRKKTKLEITFVNFLDYYINFFEQNLLIPQMPIMDIREKTLKMLQETNEDRNECIKKIAEFVRTELGLENNKDLMYTLEKSGIYIVEKKLGTQIDAYSTVTQDGRLYIVLGTVKKSAVRRNFDLAHELGHLLLHDDVDMDILSSADLKTIETEAHLFASAFLLPEMQFVKDFQSLTRKSNPDYYIELKRKYLVSIAAMEMRAYALGLLTYQENRYFWGQLNKKQYKSFEPLDDEIPPVRPGKVRALLKFVLDKEVMEIEEICKEVHIRPDFLSYLFNLETDFFKPYLTTQKDYFGHTEVIPIGDFRDKTSTR